MNTRQLCTLWLTLGLGLLLDTERSRAEAVFKAGAAKRDITPQEAVPMWGYSQRHDQLSSGTLDPLQAAAVVLQAGDQKLAIVGLDLGRSPSEKSLQNIRRRIKTESGIEHSFIAGSHTHHGPVLELSDEEGKGKGRFDAALRYYQQLEDAVVAAIVEADKSLVPAKMAIRPCRRTPSATGHIPPFVASRGRSRTSFVLYRRFHLPFCSLAGPEKQVGGKKRRRQDEKPVRNSIAFNPCSVDCSASAVKLPQFPSPVDVISIPPLVLYFSTAIWSIPNDFPNWTGAPSPAECVLMFLFVDECNGVADRRNQILFLSGCPRDKIIFVTAPDPRHREHQRHHQRDAPRLSSPAVKEVAHYLSSTGAFDFSSGRLPGQRSKYAESRVRGMTKDQ